MAMTGVFIRSFVRPKLRRYTTHQVKSSLQIVSPIYGCSFHTIPNKRTAAQSDGNAYNDRSDTPMFGGKNALLALAVGTAGALLIGGSIYRLRDKNLLAASGPKEKKTYTLEEVSKHKTKETRIWVTYKQRVYDITEFVDEHPGGSSKIILAAGGPLEPFWNLYAVHNESVHVPFILEKLHIGYTDAIATETVEQDAFKNDPKRSAVLIPSVRKPFNAEPPRSILVDNFNTPNDIFYVRNHLPVPEVDVKSFRLTVGIEGKRHTSLTLDNVKRKFAKTVVASTIQCAGNRRSEFNRFKQVKGNNWNSSAIGNAEWGGVTLREILAYSRVDIFDDKYKHVQFDGSDTGLDGEPYGASIPIEVARQRLDDIVVAYEMNGEPLSRDHGFPLRAIIPGVVGARQVKWLTKISLSTEESRSHWQRLDYKGFNPSTELKDLDYAEAVAICDLPVTSTICEPSGDAPIDRDVEYVGVKGYAWSGGGRGVIRVDVSADGGKTWHVADLQPNGQNTYGSWAWTLWEAALPVDKSVQEFELVCKATDVGYNVQPEGVEGIWNVRGVLNNCWHRVRVARK